MTPADVHYGRAEQLTTARRQILLEAQQAHASFAERRNRPFCLRRPGQPAAEDPPRCRTSPSRGGVHTWGTPFFCLILIDVDVDRADHESPHHNRGSLNAARECPKVVDMFRSKLATTRWWHTTTLPESLGVADANEDDLYAAMDWLLERQERIEKKLAGRHLKKGGLVLYDLSSSYFEGVTCPLAAMGYSRDGKRDRLQVNYGLVTDERGCPVAVSVFAGNESDSTTLMPQVEMVRNRFGIKTLVLVGDRGMISQKQIDDDLRNLEGVDWITALKSASIRKLIDGGQLQLGLFDERNLFELTHPDLLANDSLRAGTPNWQNCAFQSLLQGLREQEFKPWCSALGRGKDKIGARCARSSPRRRTNFVLDIRDDDFLPTKRWRPNDVSTRAHEASLKC